MKYRILSDEELQHLEGDLKAFLIINGVHGEEWAELNQKEPQKALELVELFSDQVLQTVYEKVKFLEHRTADSCIVFHLGEKEQELIAIQKKPGSAADLSSVDGIHEALTKTPKDLSFFTSKKNYNDAREMEIHQLIMQGAVLSDAVFWNSLKEVL